MTLEVVGEVADRTAAERARLLRRAQHPGVAVLVEDDDPEPGTGVTLGRHEGPRLGETHLTIEEIAAVFAVLATTVADLNDLGVQVGMVTGDGVHLGRDGRPVIVDLAAATIVDPPTRRGAAPNPDGRAVGVLLTHTLRRCTPEVLTEGRASGRWPRRHTPTMGQRVATLAERAAHGAIPLRQLADGLVHPDARLPRPPAAAGTGAPPETAATSGGGGIDALDTVDAVDVDTVAVGGAEIAGVAGSGRTIIEPPRQSDVTLPSGPGPRPRLGRLINGGRPRLARFDLRRAGTGPWVRRGAIGTLGVAGAVLVTLGVAAIPGPSRPHPRPSPAGSGVPPSTSVCLAVDASGTCTAPATYAGGVLSTPAGRFAVGRPDDVVAAGRWKCGAVATLAMLRPDRGEVWAFPGWPADGSVLTARLVARVAQARQLTAQADGACDALVVTRADGTTVVVDRRMFP